MELKFIQSLNIGKITPYYVQHHNKIKCNKQQKLIGLHTKIVHFDDVEQNSKK